MGSICQDILLSSLLSLSLDPTVTMLFHPRLTLLLSIVFLSFCCLTQGWHYPRPTCKYVMDTCGTPNQIRRTLGEHVQCKHDGEHEGKDCHAYCADPISWSKIRCETSDGGYIAVE